MNLTKEQEEKLREEWNNKGYWIGESIDRDLVPTPVMNKIADYWLSKINEALTAQRKEIVEGIENLRINNDPYIVGRAFYVGPMAQEKNRVHDMTLDKILSLPQLQVNEEKE